MPHVIAALAAAIAGVALHGVDHAVLHPLYDAHMVRDIILGAGVSARIVIAIGNPPLLLSS